MNLTQSLALINKNVSEFMQSIPNVNGRVIVLVLGSTGAGKSTFINFMNGCTMTRMKRNEDSYEFQIEVAQDSKVPAKVKIGHGTSSETSVPCIVENDGVIYCDCPGLKTRYPMLSFSVNYVL
jgi:putative ribosome biogenesis GTPase RsgA